MKKCSLQQKNRSGSQSQGSDSTIFMKRVTDYRQKRKARAIAACTRQKTSAARRVKQRAAKTDSQIANSSSNRDRMNDSQCNFGTNVKPDSDEGELAVKQEVVTCPFKHCTHTFKNNLELRQHMNEKHRAQLTLKSLITISPTVNKKTHLLSDEKDSGSKVESSSNTTFKRKTNQSNACRSTPAKATNSYNKEDGKQLRRADLYPQTCDIAIKKEPLSCEQLNENPEFKVQAYRGEINVKKEPINLHQPIKREPSWEHDVETTESAQKAQTPGEVVEEDRESLDELNEMQEHEDGYAGVRSEDRSMNALAERPADKFIR